MTIPVLSPPFAARPTPAVAGGQLGAPLLFVMGTLLLGGLVPLYIVNVTSAVSPTSGHAWWLPALVVGWAAARISHLIGIGAPRLFEFVFWLYTYLFLGLAPLAQVRLNRYPLTAPGVDNSFAAAASAVVICGLLAFEAGGQIAKRRSRSSASAARRPFDISAVRSALLAVAGLMGAAYYVYRLGPATLLSSRDGISQARAAAWPDLAVSSVFTAAGFAPLLVATHALVYLRRRSGSASRRWPYLVTIICCLGVMNFVVNPISSARYIFGTVGFSLLALYGAFSNPRRTRIWLSVVVAIMIFIFPYADLFRRDSVIIQRQGAIELLAGKGDYDSFPQLQNSIEYVKRNGFVNGRQALGVAAFWLPRSVWTDKPTDTAILVAEDRGYRITNLSEPLWGEAYVNGGLPATVLVFAFLGMLLRIWDGSLSSSLPEQSWRATAGSICAFYMFIVLRGSLLQATGFLAVLVLCLLFIRSVPRVHQ